MAVRCQCGKYYHESCGFRVGECPKCESVFNFDKLPTQKDAEFENFEDIELIEQSPAELVDKKKSSLKEEKSERKKMARILSKLEERLAEGEISEKTYLMLRKKYNK